MEHYLFIDEKMRLGSLALQITNSARHVSVLAPDEAYLKNLTARGSKNGFDIFTATTSTASANDALGLAYKLSELRSAVQKAVGERGPADVTVVWLNEQDPMVTVVIAQALRDLAVFTEYYDVITADSDLSKQQVREGRLRSFENVWYRKIVVSKDAEAQDEAVTSGIASALKEKRDAFSVGA